MAQESLGTRREPTGRDFQSCVCFNPLTWNARRCNICAVPMEGEAPVLYWVKGGQGLQGLFVVLPFVDVRRASTLRAGDWNTLLRLVTRGRVAR